MLLSLLLLLLSLLLSLLFYYLLNQEARSVSFFLNVDGISYHTNIFLNNAVT